MGKRHKPAFFIHKRILFNNKCTNVIYRKKPFIGLLIFFVLIYFFYYEKEKPCPSNLYERFLTSSLEEFGLANPNTSCKFPVNHPFNSEVMKYFSVPEEIKCRGTPLYHYGLIYMNNDGYLVFNQTAIKSMSFGLSYINCEYSEINYKGFVKESSSFKMGVYEPFTGKVKPESDFVYVRCKNYFGWTVFSDFFAYARSVNARNYQNDVEMSVAVIGLDAMSRLNFIRQFPRSYLFMKNELKSIEMLGYNKVGLNTFPNCMAMLTGKPAPRPPYHHFKDWKFIWDDFENEGSATMYAEDLPSINMFVLHGQGIDHKPTQHYAFPFWEAVEQSSLLKSSSKNCLGLRKKISTHLNYLKSFLKVYRKSPSFLFSLHNELTHDLLNTGGAMDDDLYTFLKSSHDEGFFNRTVLIVLGDHGNRLDPYRVTNGGKIEDFMPLMSIILPDWAEEVYGWRSFLLENAGQLTTGFDLYKTFVDILSTLNSSSSRLNYLKNKEFGISFFQKIPLNRTCLSAGIPEWFCTCTNADTKITKLSNNDSRAIQAAKLIVKEMNDKLVNFTECATLKLVSIEDATYTRINTNSYKIQSKISTVPGHGLFETSIKIKYGNKFEVGSIVRINKYGNQPNCLPKNLTELEETIKSTCYCSELMKKQSKLF